MTVVTARLSESRLSRVLLSQSGFYVCAERLRAIDAHRERLVCLILRWRRAPHFRRREVVRSSTVVNVSWAVGRNRAATCPIMRQFVVGLSNPAHSALRVAARPGRRCCSLAARAVPQRSNRGNDPRQAGSPFYLTTLRADNVGRFANNPPGACRFPEERRADLPR
jgi:hypothetical protein